MNDEPRRVPAPDPVDSPAIDEHEVDDVIDHAEALKRADEGKLSLEQLKEIGRDVDIEEKYVERAVDKVVVERRELAAEVAARTARREALKKRLAITGGASLALYLLVTFFVALGARSRMSTAMVEVDARRAQVTNVIERQKVVEARYAGRTPTPESEAEISGAENRVRIERRRYDEAAAAYNGEARSFGAGVASTLFGLPSHVPTSSEVSGW